MEEYSYLSGGVPQADGKRGHQCRVHEILLNIIVYSDYELKRILTKANPSSPSCLI